MANLHIPLPPAQLWAQHTDSDSPYAVFYTPPESPSVFYTPPQSPAPVPLLPPSPTHPQNTDDHFPTHVDPAIDLPLDDDNLSILEKIYLYSRSKAPFHRVFIAHALPQYLNHVSTQDAVAYVLPLLSGLAMDDDEQVKEAFAAELVPVVWWFFSHCQVIPDELDPEAAYASSSSTVTISVQAFTPILGTLLLSPNPLVGGAARFAVVDLLSRMKRADDRERELHGVLREELDLPTAGPMLPAAAVAAAMVSSTTPIPSAPHHTHHTHHTDQTSTHTPGDLIHPWEIVQEDDDDEDKVPLVIGCFGEKERALFTHEILQQVVIGMGKLDDADYDDDDLYECGQDEQGTEEQHQGRTYNSEEGARMVTEDDISPRPLEPVSPENSSQSVPGSSNPYFPAVVAEPSAAALEAAHNAKYMAMPWYSPPVAPVTAAAPVAVAQSPAAAIPARPISPGVEFPPSPSSMQSSSPRPSYLERFSSSGANEGNFPLGSARDLGQVPSAMDADYNWDMDVEYEGDEGEDEQAAVGRLSSMSLMAAVTASGTLNAEMQRAFVDEVQHVGGDPVYWVRREASFALGALAKVVPEELVLNNLLPLFDTLRRDAVWHVRHSVLFALPAILERLAPDHRKSVALETISSLVQDQSPTVRSGVLEALGEVIHTFNGDPEGPPKELLALFLGIRDGTENTPWSAAIKPLMPTRSSMASIQSQQSVTSEVLYDDPKRNLICAFNFPAVALTLGTGGWQILRESYLAIAKDPSTSVRRTLAASIGELARIVGTEGTRRDLVDVWHVYLRAEEEEVRSKAIETVSLLMTIAGGREAGRGCIRALGRCWEDGILRGWREREMVVRGLVRWLRLVGVGFGFHDLDEAGKFDDAETVRREKEEQREIATVAEGLLIRGLEDSVAAVRESSVLVTPDLWRLFAEDVPGLTDELESDLAQLAASTNYRRRMTFVGCRQALALALDEDDRPLMFPFPRHPNEDEKEKEERVKKDEAYLQDVIALARDDILGVRIGVARFAGTVHASLIQHGVRVPDALRGLVKMLTQDPSQEVRAYVAEAARESTGPPEYTESLESAIAAIPMASPGSLAHPAIGASIANRSSIGTVTSGGGGTGDSFPGTASTSSSMSMSSASSAKSSSKSKRQAQRATFSRPPPTMIVSPGNRSLPASGQSTRPPSSQAGYFDLVVPKRPSSAMGQHASGGLTAGSSGTGSVSAPWASLGLGQAMSSPLMYSPGTSGYSSSGQGSVVPSLLGGAGLGGTRKGEAAAAHTGGSGSNTAAVPAPASSLPSRDVPMEE